MFFGAHLIIKRERMLQAGKIIKIKSFLAF